MTLVWRYVVRFFCHKSISAPASLYTYTLCVCVCFSRSTASGCSLTQSFNSNCRLFVWVRPYKHTIRPALCTEDYSWLWPQFSSGLLPGSLEVPAGKPQVLPEPRKIRTTAHRPSHHSETLACFNQARPTASLKCQLEGCSVCVCHISTSFLIDC